MIREKGSDAAAPVCACGQALPEGLERGNLCPECSPKESAREMAAAVNLRELGS